ncbi:MAG: hypothetical protein V1858_05045 [Candidatus Gottesmanbacteria bacterium]
MTKQLFRDAVGWGFLLWLIGYTLGIILFPFVPSSIIGWVIMPIGTIITLFVLFKKVESGSLVNFFKIAVAWTFIAIILDYLLLVKLFKPADGYYKLDVYLYYILTFVLPLIVGWRKIGTHVK